MPTACEVTKMSTKIRPRRDRRQQLLDEIARLADVAIFGTLAESYRTCGSLGCRCRGDGPKHGPHLYMSYRGDAGKTTGYYVPKAAQKQVRAGVAAWQRLQERLRELADLNKTRAFARPPDETAP
jgi:Family of unknown function (DUF6788)